MFTRSTGFGKRNDIPSSRNKTTQNTDVGERERFLEANKKSALTVTWAWQLVNYQPEPESEARNRSRESRRRVSKVSFASLVEPEPHDSWSEEESLEERSDSPRLVHLC